MLFSCYRTADAASSSTAAATTAAADCGATYDKRAATISTEASTGVLFLSVSCSFNIIL